MRGSRWISLMMVGGVDLVFLLEHQVTGMRADIQPADAERATALGEAGDLQQLHGGCRQRAESIADLGLQLVSGSRHPVQAAMRLYKPSLVCTSPM